MSIDISNTDDVIDSRDVIARIEELEAEQSNLEDDIEFTRDRLKEVEEDERDVDNSDEISARSFAWREAVSALKDWEGEFADELKALRRLQDDAEGYAPDWKYGATLVHEDYWVEYCEEMLKDCGDLPRDIPAYIEIDWVKTAENLKADYTEVDFDGETYWVR